jgi:drug/metabolite transporter (DMT)-like permease
LGETIAIACSFIWSLAVICFKIVGEDIHPTVLNFFKNWLGAILLIPTVLLIDGPLTQSIPNSDLFILIFSGVLGIGLADFFVLKGLSQINASKLAIVECAYSPFVIFLSVLFLGEVFTITRFIGTSCVLGAVLLISTGSKSPHSNEKPSDPMGILWCLAGILSMAIGIVMVKPLFESVPLFWVIQIRLAAGAVGGSFLLFLVRILANASMNCFTPKGKSYYFWPVF